MKFIFNKNGDIYYSENNEQLKQYSVNANNLIVAFNDINIRDYTPYIVFERADGKTTPLIGMAFTTIEYGGLPYQAVQYGFNDLWVTAVSGELKFNVVLKKNNTVIYNGGLTLWVTESIKENELIYIDDVAYTQLNNRIASLEKDMGDIKNGSLVVKESEKATNDSLGNPIHTTYAKSVNVPTKTSQLTNDSKFVTEDNIPTKISQLDNDSNYVNEDDLKSALGNIVSFKVEIVDILPTQDISSSTIYLVKNESDEDNNSYYEYLYINNRWELIGTTQVNFNAYDKVDKIIPTGDGGKFEYIYSKGSDEFYFAKRDADGNFISLLKFYKNGIQMKYKDINFILSDSNGTGLINYIERDGIKRRAELSVSAFGPQLSFATMDTNKGETQWQVAGGIDIDSTGVSIRQLTGLDERSQNYIKNLINPLLTNKVNRYELPTNTGDLINTSGFVSNFKKIDNPIALNEGVWKFNESNTATLLIEKNISITINFKDSLGNEFIRMNIAKTKDRAGWNIIGVRANNTSETIYKHIVPEYEWDYEKTGLAVITNKSILRNDYYLIFEEDNTNNVGSTGKTLLQNFIDWGIVSKYKEVEFVDKEELEELVNAGGNVDLSNYYNKTETDELLYNKADKNNIPTKISQLENDSNFVDKKFVEDTLSEVTGGTDASAVKISLDAHKSDTNNPHNVNASQLGLGNVDNTSDLDKPISTATQIALNGKVNTTLLGANNGIAILDSNGKVPTSQLPSYVDDVLEYSSKSSFPTNGETGKIYVDTATNKTYRWGGSSYVEISSSLALGETSSTAYSGNKGKANADAITQLQNNKANSADLSKVATSGSYNDLSNKPTIPTKTSQLTNDSNYAYKSELFSKNYNDLTNKPTIPSAYTLPTASSSTLGGVKVGSNITLSNGTISLSKSNVTNALGYTPPTSTGSVYLHCVSIECDNGFGYIYFQFPSSSSSRISLNNFFNINDVVELNAIISLDDYAIFGYGTVYRGGNNMFTFNGMAGSDGESIYECQREFSNPDNDIDYYKIIKM